MSNRLPPDFTYANRSKGSRFIEARQVQVPGLEHSRKQSSETLNMSSWKVDAADLFRQPNEDVLQWHVLVRGMSRYR